MTPLCHRSSRYAVGSRPRLKCRRPPPHPSGRLTELQLEWQLQRRRGRRRGTRAVGGLGQVQATAAAAVGVSSWCGPSPDCLGSPHCSYALPLSIERRSGLPGRAQSLQGEFRHHPTVGLSKPPVGPPCATVITVRPFWWIAFGAALMRCPAFVEAPHVRSALVLRRPSVPASCLLPLLLLQLLPFSR